MTKFYHIGGEEARAEKAQGSARKGVTVMVNLSEVETCDLVRELSQREGVERTIAEPYQDVQVKVNGPAIVLVVID